MNTRQKGLATLEFVLIAAVFLTLIFGIIEFSVLLYTWNTLTEATRRGARVAAVCPASALGVIRNIVVYNSASGGAAPVVHGLTTSMVQIAYDPLSGPYPDRYARPSVQVWLEGYAYNLHLPLLQKSYSASFLTTAALESGGLLPTPGGSGSVGCP